MNLRTITYIWIVFLNTAFLCYSNHVPKELSEFLQMEENMLDNLDNFIAQERERLNILKGNIQEWKDMRTLWDYQEEHYVQNPVNMFHLFKRLTIGLEELEKLIIKNSFEETMDENLIIPTDDDLKDVINSMLKLQYQYKLTPRDLMFGRLQNFSAKTYLSVEDCIYIGEICQTKNDHACAVDWLKECLRYVQNDEQKKTVLKMLYPSYIYLGDDELAFKYATEYLTFEPLEISASDVKLEKGGKLDKLSFHEPYIIESRRTCRGVYANSSLTQNNKCRYNHMNSPFLKLAPLKEEVLYDEPRIVIYREAIYDLEINSIKKWSALNLKGSTVYGNDGKSRVSGFIYRISETAFLDNNAPFLENLRKRIVDISTMSLENSEALQVIHYAPGGFYRVHSDYLPQNAVKLENRGNRMISMLFYMNDVTLGGGTIFPRLKLLVEPEKGSILVWHNMHPDGTENVLLQHCACPVVLGEKWAFTQWIRSLNQHTIRNFYTVYEQNIDMGTTKLPEIENLGTVPAFKSSSVKTFLNNELQMEQIIKK